LNGKSTQSAYPYYSPPRDSTYFIDHPLDRQMRLQSDDHRVGQQQSCPWRAIASAASCPQYRSHMKESSRQYQP
jgi:hypothetical protein